MALDKEGTHMKNVRYPGKHLNPKYLHLQDELLAEEREGSSFDTVDFLFIEIYVG